METLTTISKKLLPPLLLLAFSCRGYGIRIEFVTPEDNGRKEEEVQKERAADRQQDPSSLREQKDGDTDPASAPNGQDRSSGTITADFDTAFQNWSATHKWLVRVLDGGTSSPGLIKPEIAHAQKQLLTLLPFFKDNREKQNALNALASEYGTLSNLYTRRRRGATAELLKLLERNIIHLASGGNP